MAQEIQEFVAPEWVNNQSIEEIHKRMMEGLPPEIDRTEGGFPWDFTRPTAIEKSELVEFCLVEVLKNIFPKWSSGQILDYHAECRGLSRKTAISSTVDVNIEGTPGVKVPEGFSFSTLSTRDSESLQFITKSDEIISAEGTLSVKCTSVQTGKVCNVAEGAIQLMTTSIDGITNVTNNKAAVGGDDEEVDDDLIQRILEYDRSQGESFVGSVSDYKRWAESFEDPTNSERVGNAKVVLPTFIEGDKESEKIKIIVTGNNGANLTDGFCKALEDYIMGTNDREKRLAPINALVSVSSPEEVEFFINAQISLDIGYELSIVKEQILNAIISYLPECRDEIKYSQIGKLILSAHGVLDYNNLQIKLGDGIFLTQNIQIDGDKVAVTDDAKVGLTICGTQN